MAGEGGSRRTFSLRAHLLLLIVGTMVPALVLAAFLARRVVADSREAIQGRLLEAARAEAALVDAELAGSIRALEGLAESSRLTDGDIAGFYAQAQRLLASQPTWSAISVATPDGRQIVNTERPVGAPLPFWTDRDSVQRTVEGRQPTIGNLRTGGITGQLGFPVRVPVVRDGRVEYVVSAWITSREFGNMLRRQASISDEWVRGVTDRNGVLVARSRDADQFVGRKSPNGFVQQAEAATEGVYRGRAVDGLRVYSAFSRAPMSRWIAGVAVPASTVGAPFRQSLLALGAIALLLFGIGSAGAYVISKRISREIRRSAADAEAIASGLSPSLRSSRVTEIQRLTDALSRSTMLLATRQRERDEQVARADAARAEAEAADRAKDDFLAMLGHELRNPLAPALTALHLMKVKGGAAARERDVIERQIRHMARLVDDLLDVSRLRRGTIELRRERVDVAEVVARAVEIAEPLLTERGHQLEVDVQPGLAIDADRVRLAQVLSNLLSNAAKYTNPGGHVALSARAEDGEVVVECRDTGIGMPPELVPRVFDLFVQGQRGLDRREGGLGLGLAVARTLVELHGGRIAAASDGPLHGSTFTVRLPQSKRAASKPAEAPLAAAAAASIGRVLVVDDNRDALEMLVDALRESGVDAIGAADAAEALAAASADEPRAAILDIGLPDMDGFELARALRSRSAPTLRLIALTGYGRSQDMAVARAAGFDVFFVKPVDVQVLLAALEPGVAAR